ncbi:MAG: Slp family lipoprotein [Nitrospirota bacterium]
MKGLWIIAIAVAALSACSPVLNREFMDQGAREFQLNHLIETPEVFKDRLFILGGVIVDSRLTATGSQIEALFVPVNSYGALRDTGQYEGRFLAVYPRSKGLLDPLIYKKGREITLAGDFVGVRTAKIDELEYAYPVFEIRQIHLWEEYRQYPYAWPYPSYYPYYPYYYYYQPFLYDPWIQHYPGPYWPPPPW